MRHRLFPLRSSSAIPVPLPRESQDPVVQAGRLWERHHETCAVCEPATPGCDLGHKAYDLYVWLALTEGR
jgi:hypothetical protein